MNAKIINTTKLRKNIASVLDAVSEDDPIYIISRNGQQKHAIVDLDYSRGFNGSQQSSILERNCRGSEASSSWSSFCLVSLSYCRICIRAESVQTVIT